MAGGPTERSRPPALPRMPAHIPGPSSGEPASSASRASSDGARVPHWLLVGGAWSWRLIAIGLVAYYLLRFVLKIELVVLPFLGAMVFTALLRPISKSLQRHGVSRLVATWATFLGALIVVLAIGTLVVYRSVAEWHVLVHDLSTTTAKARHWLATGPLNMNASDLKDMQQKLVDTFNSHRGVVVNDLISGASIVGEFLAGMVLCAFITFFLLHDGERIWRFLRSPAKSGAARRINAAAVAAWHTLAGYVRGSVVIATFHAVVIAISLAILGVPLVAPLALLVFVTSFMPLVGVLIGGGLSVFVTFGTHGVTAGLVLLGILIVEHQVEGHLLQPFIMGRYVNIHPLAIALALAIGGVLQGIVGAIVAVPLVAMAHAAWPKLKQPEIVIAEAPASADALVSEADD